MFCQVFTPSPERVCLIMEKIYPMIHISADLKGFRETSQGRELSFVQSRRSVASSSALTETYVIWIRGGISIETESATLGEWNVTLDFISFATLTHEIERWPAKRNRREKKKKVHFHTCSLSTQFVDVATSGWQEGFGTPRGWTLIILSVRFGI